MKSQPEQETKNGVPAVRARTRKEWRSWLAKNHDTAGSVWLILFHKKSVECCISYEEAVEEALCYGWIDSRANKRDDTSYYLYFAQRKPRGNWSQSNKDRVARLVAQGLMTPAGQAYIDMAKQLGTWDTLTETEQGVIPQDLREALEEDKQALENFQAFSPSAQKSILQWISSAKKSETRLKRIQQTVELAHRNIKAH